MRSGIEDSVPSLEDWQAIDSLVDFCRACEGLELSMHRLPPRNDREKNQFRYYEADELVGIATIPPGLDAEVLGTIHPDYRRQGIGRSLLAAVVNECRRRGIKSYLLVVEAASQSGRAFAERLGGIHEHSEHLMELDWDNAQSNPSKTLQVELVPALRKDVEDLIEVRRDQIDDIDESRRNLAAWIASDVHQLLVVRHNNQVVGMIRVSQIADVVWLNSFAIHKSYRGRGIGHQVLAEVIQDQDPSSRILLEVETDNGPAVALYRRIGFRERATYFYYRNAV
jgi:ribosomal protein S18 acetylase RimI-like enzyme